MMLGFIVNVEIVDNDGHSTWTTLTVQPEEGSETVDLKLPEDVILGGGDIIMVKPKDLRRALTLAITDMDLDRTQDACCLPELNP